MTREKRIRIASGWILTGLFGLNHGLNDPLNFFFLRIIGIFYEELVNGTLLVVDNMICHIASCIENILRCQIASTGAVAKWDVNPVMIRQHCTVLSC